MAADQSGAVNFTVQRIYDTNIHIPEYKDQGERAGNVIGPKYLNVDEIDIRTLDVETMMAMVLSQRADNLNFTQTLQAKQIQWRNQLIERLNEKIAELQKLRAQGGPGKLYVSILKDSELAKKQGNITAENLRQISETGQYVNKETGEIYVATEHEKEAAEFFHKNSPSFWGEVDVAAADKKDNKDGSASLDDMNQYLKEVDNETTKVMDADISGLKSQVDALSGTNNIDVIRFQALLQKANEALEQISTIYKKIADTRGKIWNNV